MTPNDKIVLLWMERNSTPDESFWPFGIVSKATEISVKQVRLSCRRLARNGFLKFQRGLWSEDGEPRGAGYGITQEGWQRARKLLSEI